MAASVGLTNYVSGTVTVFVKEKFWSASVARYARLRRAPIHRAYEMHAGGVRTALPAHTNLSAHRLSPPGRSRSRSRQNLQRVGVDKDRSRDGAESNPFVFHHASER